MTGAASCRHEIFRADGKLSARVTSTGGWLDLNERRLVAPPPPLLAAMNSLERTEDFVVLPSRVKPRPLSHAAVPVGWFERSDTHRNVP